MKERFGFRILNFVDRYPRTYFQFLLINSIVKKPKKRTMRMLVAVLFFVDHRTRKILVHLVLLVVCIFVLFTLNLTNHIFYNITLPLYTFFATTLFLTSFFIKMKHRSDQKYLHSSMEMVQ